MRTPTIRIITIIQLDHEILKKYLKIFNNGVNEIRHADKQTSDFKLNYFTVASAFVN